MSLIYQENKGNWLTSKLILKPEFEPNILHQALSHVSTIMINDLMRIVIDSDW